MGSENPVFPLGVRLRELTTHVDDRGELTEVFRAEWQDAPAPVQWNFVRSQKHVLRGVHVHPEHDDYLLVLQSRMILGLKDLRRASPTYGVVAMLELDGARLSSIRIPHGVAHGFYFPADALYLYAVTHYWNVLDELRCRWDDPDLGLRWPTDAPLLSDADRTAGTLSEMTRDFEARTRIAPVRR